MPLGLCDTAAMALPPDADSVDRHVARWVGVVPEMDPEVEAATTRMQAVVRHLGRTRLAQFADGDDTLEDYVTLHALLVQPYPEEATPAQLADECHVTRAAMTSRLDRLVEAGHVSREVDPGDRRRVIIRPTRSGRELWQRHLKKGMAQEQEALSPLSTAELTQLNALLRKVVRHLDGDT